MAGVVRKKRGGSFIFFANIYLVDFGIIFERMNDEASLIDVLIELQIELLMFDVETRYPGKSSQRASAEIRSMEPRIALPYRFGNWIILYCVVIDLRVNLSMNTIHID